LRRPGVAALLALALSGLVAGAVGCGEGDGVEAGATVHVYVVGLICGEAQRQLKSKGGRAGDFRVRVVCLPPSGDAARVDLAAAGANARRATSVAYLEAPGPSNAFSRTIVEEAGIGFLDAASGFNAMRRILQEIEASGSGSLRDQVRNTVEAG
jgi:hypothetical protein